MFRISTLTSTYNSAAYVGTAAAGFGAVRNLVLQQDGGRSASPQQPLHD